MSTRLRIGIFGGTFNPIHTCHLQMGARVRDLLGLDRLIFVPAAQPPHKTADLAPARDRLAMTRLAVADCPGFEVDDLELTRAGPSYSVDTVEIFQARYPEADRYFVVGSEMFRDFGTWRAPERILAAASVVVIARASYPFAPLAGLRWLGETSAEVLASFDAVPGEGVLDLRPSAPLVLVKPSPCDTSSTRVRRDLAAGRPVKNLLPGPVHSYILKQRLYGARDADH
ncbi:MAG: nicotinate-nucleotide adenylyltransferase [Nitrospiria bacterium]